MFMRTEFGIITYSAEYIKNITLSWPSIQINDMKYIRRKKNI